jgi:hypothetical protein
MEEGVEKTRKQKREIRNWKVEIGNWQSYFLVSDFQFPVSFHYFKTRNDALQATGWVK